MITANKLIPLRRLAICALVFFHIVLTGQQSQFSDTDRIKALMTQLGDHSGNPTDILDPQLTDQQRKKNLNYLRDPSYELTLTPEGDINVGETGNASVPVRVHFKSSTNELDANMVAKFVRRGNAWYFANFEFLGWPPMLIAVLVASLAIGVSYAIGGLIVVRRLHKRGKLRGANLIKMFIPLFWPQLFSETRADRS